MKRTYKLNEIANKIRKSQTTVVEWSNQFGEYLPTIAVNGFLRYTDEALELFQLIAKLKVANKPIKVIKEHLQDMYQKEKRLIPEEKSLTPISTQDSDTQMQVPDTPSTLQSRKETTQLREMIQLITPKMEGNTSSSRAKEQVNDLNQLVGISSISTARRVPPSVDFSNMRIDPLKDEVTALRNLVHMLVEKVSNLEEQISHDNHLTNLIESLNVLNLNVTDEITELRSLFKNFTLKVVEVLELDNTSEITANVGVLTRQFERLSDKVAGITTGLQAMQQWTSEALKQEDKDDILTATTELLSQQYGEFSMELDTVRSSVVEVVKQLNNRDTASRVDKLSIQVKRMVSDIIGIQNVLQAVQIKVAEASEQDVKGDILNVTKELLSQQYEGISEELVELHEVILLNKQLVTEELEQGMERMTSDLSGLQNELQEVQKLAEKASELDVKDEILTVTKELISQQYEGISGELVELHEVVLLNKQLVTADLEQGIERMECMASDISDLQNVLQAVQKRAEEASEQDVKGEILTVTKELLSQQYEGISEELVELHEVILLNKQLVTAELEQEMESKLTATTESLGQRHEVIAGEVAGLHNDFDHLTQKVTELLKEVLTFSNTSKEDSFHQEVQNLSQQMSSQQLLLDKIAKFLGI